MSNTLRRRMHALRIKRLIARDRNPNPGSQPNRAVCTLEFPLFGNGSPIEAADINL
jgi:hypothetical protein